MTKFKKLLSVCLALIMVLSVMSVVTFSADAGSAPKGSNVVKFHPGILSKKGVTWYAWTWSGENTGYWVKGGKNASEITFKKIADSVVFVRMPKGYTKPSWEDMLNQSVDLKVKGSSFKVTKMAGVNKNWGTKDFTGKWSGKMINPLTVKVKSKSISVKSLKKSKKTVKPLKIKNAKGKVVVKKVKKGTTASIYKKITVNKKTGAVTFKKGKYSIKTYKVKLKVTAKGNSSYTKKSIAKTVKIKLKKSISSSKKKNNTTTTNQSTTTTPIRHRCSICGGMGRYVCTSCGGRGVFNNFGGMVTFCSGCNGRAYITCTACGGDGYID